MNKQSVRRLSSFLVLMIVVSLLGTACRGKQPIKHNWTRSDMPTDGLDTMVYYVLDGEANGRETNVATLSGVNNSSPMDRMITRFTRMSGTKRQQVTIYLPDGTPVQALGMNKIKRTSGSSEYLTLEAATFEGIDQSGASFCGVEVRLDFKKNLDQAVRGDFMDFESRWFYAVPCLEYDMGFDTELDIANAQLLSVSINHVWQARVFGDPIFASMQEGIVVRGGILETLEGGWWGHFDIPDDAANGRQDAIEAANMLNRLVHDMESSPMPWLEFTPGGEFDASGTYTIASIGDADRYATFDRIFLNRQSEYAFFYRPDRYTAWDYIRIQPLYNLEWNDVWDNLADQWGRLRDLINNNGQPNDPHAQQLREYERAGWMNAPNIALDQIRWLDSEGNLLFSMTVRAHVGARDTLVLFTRELPSFDIRNQVSVDTGGMPVVFGTDGKPVAEQPYTAEQWAELQRENSFWNYLKDNPFAISTDLMVQYRFEDSSTWTARMCNRYDSDGHQSSYVCGYDPAEWHLASSYYFDEQDPGDLRGTWLALQLLGPVGMQTVGLSYTSGLFAGTGMEFALDQQVLYERFQQGFTQEDIFMLDARALNTPGTLAEAWAWIHSQE